MLEIDHRCRYCLSYSPISHSDALFANCSYPGHEGEIVLGLASGCPHFSENKEKLGRLPLYKPEEAEEAQIC